MAGVARKTASYADLDALPEGTKAHRRRRRHLRAAAPVDASSGGGVRPRRGAASSLSRGRGGPGGWVILIEPEIRLDASSISPDLGGWRRERMPEPPRAAHATIAPDWVCEILSPSTAAFDRGKKLDTYASWGVSHAWLVDPDAFTLEAYRLEDGRWVRLGTGSDRARGRVEPFDAIELTLDALWTR
jgi:hypothetical protein